MTSQKDSRQTPSYLEDLIARDPSTGTPEHVKPGKTAQAHSVSNPAKSAHNPSFLKKLIDATPSKIGVGRSGSRYKTNTYIRLREDHAIAKDAVYSELDEHFANEMGCIEVTSMCEDRHDFLLNPNKGRRLSNPSRQKLRGHVAENQDIQIILADGLSAKALSLGARDLLKALTGSLLQKGFKLGPPIMARLARVGLQDDIGILTKTKATIIAIGERPGLGTGDSLSLYLAINPKLDQDNAEKNCISNIRPGGLSCSGAALLVSDLIERGLQLGQGGLVLETGRS